MTLISIQINNSEGTWDDIKPTFHEVSNPAEAAQLIANATGKAIRMTRPDNRFSDVGRFNGSYIHPEMIH